MKLFVILMGGIFSTMGLFSILGGNSGFAALAFPIGASLILSGMVMVMAYKVVKGNNEMKHWVLIDGATTFMVGLLIITGTVASNSAVGAVIGLWVLISGIRSIALIIEDTDDINTKEDLMWNLIVGISNMVLAAFMFFGGYLGLSLALPVQIGIAIILHAFVMIKLGIAMSYQKPETIKKREEIQVEAENEVERAQMHASKMLEEVANTATALEQAKIAAKEAKEAAKAAKEQVDFAKSEAKRKAEEFKTYEEIVCSPVEVE